MGASFGSPTSPRVNSARSICALALLPRQPTIAPGSPHKPTRLKPPQDGREPTGCNRALYCTVLHSTPVASARGTRWQPGWTTSSLSCLRRTTASDSVRATKVAARCARSSNGGRRLLSAHQHSAIGQGARCRAAGAYTGVGVDTFRCLYLMLPDKLKALRASVVSPLVNLISTMRLITVVSGKAFQYGCAIAFVRLAAASLSQAMYGAESCIGPGGALPAGGEVEREVERVCLGRPRRGVTVAH